jgi:hypothetical protein
VKYLDIPERCVADQVPANDQQPRKAHMPRLKIIKRFQKPKSKLDEHSVTVVKTVQAIVRLNNKANSLS